ncbi:hypothetical protein FGLOB1_8368 [Fusarium globosum]|uniref:Methyltransferase type 12 domain-containing protein n=1 Tax=Fusarium globosum TaxID=78864 RepID=A0A8H6D636_9HYPO|nr:hypothetical protein FGLOB1_8368 [Fusarium globosum]
MALKAGYTSTKMRAIQADLIDPDLTPSPEIDTPGFFDFDVVVMCMALHHIEDPDNMVLQLSKRLRPGGILLIIDWVKKETPEFIKKPDSLESLPLSWSSALRDIQEVVVKCLAVGTISACKAVADYCDKDIHFDQ